MAFDRDAWLPGAEAAGLDPLVIGFVYRHPHYVGDPECWVDVSRALEDGRGMEAAAALVPGGRGGLFAAVCAEAEGLPDAAACLTPDAAGRPFRLGKQVVVDVAYMLCVRLVREVVARWAGPKDVEFLCAFLKENFQPEMTIFTVRLLVDGHGLDMEGHMPPEFFEAYPMVAMIALGSGR